MPDLETLKLHFGSHLPRILTFVITIAATTLAIHAIGMVGGDGASWAKTELREVDALLIGSTTKGGNRCSDARIGWKKNEDLICK